MLTVAASTCSALAILGIGLAIHLVWLGAYPPEGEGSLGHVGAVIAGLIVGFAAVVFALLGLYTGLRARTARHSSRPVP
jgi:hypothetical protein